MSDSFRVLANTVWNSANLDFALWAKLLSRAQAGQKSAAPGGNKKIQPSESVASPPLHCTKGCQHCNVLLMTSLSPRHEHAVPTLYCLEALTCSRSCRSSPPRGRSRPPAPLHASMWAVTFSCNLRTTCNCAVRISSSLAQYPARTNPHHTCTDGSSQGVSSRERSSAPPRFFGVASLLCRF